MIKTEAKQKITELVEKYEQAKRTNSLKKYSEEDTKKGFIAPLFEALGWDFQDRDEISSEEHVKSSGFIDYGFYLDGRAKFYLEAKKLGADLHNEEFAKQAIRYSWNKGVTWAILTDFESLKVFYAQSVSQHLGDKLYFEIKADEYLERFDELWRLSKEAFTKNVLDDEAEKAGKKYQKISVTETLYKDLNESRALLLKSFRTWNPEIPDDLLEEGVQKMLDRLIFIRVAEDRNLEDRTLLPMLRSFGGSSSADFFKHLVNKFRELDEIYNSNLFAPHPFESWQEYDGKTGEVIKKLYGKQGYYEYDFKAIPADILGSVYENYLGYKLSLSDKGIDVSKDSRKRKEQGIYYTPTHIVDYIVTNALKPVLDKCESVDDIRKIKILDPACGSGSFLIRAMEMIFEWYKEYNPHADEFTKIDILINNIFGVDLDEQAVEIARLNLLINALDSRMKLPDLSRNIKNGNSLVSGLPSELEGFFGKKYREKKPFNWTEEFPQVFERENPGFDVIIGNPPYVNIANIKDANDREYLRSAYVTAKNKVDLYSFFTEKSVTLLRKKGMLGFIFSNTWLGTDSFSKFRHFLLANTNILKLVKLPAGVFEGATVTTVLMFLQKSVDKNHEIELFSFEDSDFKKLTQRLSHKKILSSSGYTISFNAPLHLDIETDRLGDIGKFSLGIKTSDDKQFISGSRIDETSYPLLRGKDVYRYFYHPSEKWLWYRPDLMMKKVGAGPRKPEYFRRDKLLFRSITGGNIIAAFDDKEHFTNDKVHVLYNVNNYSLKFILGIANSSLIDKWIRSTFNDLLEIKINQLEQIPIPKLNMFENESKARHDEIVKQVDIMLNLHNQLIHEPENSNKWKSLKNEIEQTDKQINQLVYKLYGLDNENISIT